MLEREIILQDDLDPSVIQTAQDRWMQLANQSQMKMGGGAPAMEPPAPAAQGAGTAGTPISSTGTPPMGAGNPPMGMLDTMQQMSQGIPEPEANAQIADSLSQQA